MISTGYSQQDRLFSYAKYFDFINMPYLALFIVNFLLLLVSFTLTAQTITKELNQDNYQKVKQAFKHQTKPLIVRYNQSTLFDDNQKYYGSLLTLALEETLDDFGPYQLVPVNINMVQQRSINMLSSEQNIDVLWAMTSNKREQVLQAVYVPLLKGLIGSRVFLIRDGDQSRFSDISSLTELNTLLAGQGLNWPDTEILRANNIPTVDALTRSLHAMLERRRFDYFPRAITEISVELAQYPSLTLERHLMLVYTAPLYFFVNKKNSALANRLQIGLMRAINKGTFDQLFYRLKAPPRLMAQLNIENRIIFKLENPLLSEKTKQLQGNKNLWLSLD